jgi:DNA-directed RNA polymerase subunit RPC12/RpoP
MPSGFPWEDDVEFPVAVVLTWLAVAVFIWCETPAEPAERIEGSSKSAVACPTCGYNLTGLSEARCPECGTRFTLDELLALQPNADKDLE